ncbi:MAG: N-formylglutamate amidohydrolase [Bacilli bacterium]|nr:N-formylglutamate amidohydrolase [Bacilli bacterium]
MNKFIIHVPHASLEVPEEFTDKLLVDRKYFDKENIFICDYKVDDFIPNNFNNIVKFNYSRMFCDVEKYLDDSKEVMSKYGMGAVYTKDSNGKEFIKVDDKYKEEVISKYYKKHHKELDKIVGKVLSNYKDCFIIDLHSFSDEFVYKMFNKKNTPDICIGINKDNYDKELLVKTINFFKSNNYSIRVNYPFSGSITSNKYPEVKSIMIEINKRVYLDDKNNYNKFHNCMMNYYKILK